MKPARFSYEAPATVAAALAALTERRDAAKIIAGGQSLAPMMNMRIAEPGHLIDINGLAELAHIRLEADHLVVGALTRHADLARHPLARAHAAMLAHAASTIGHYAIRQRGTIGGSLAHADPAAQLPLVAVALDARIEVASDGKRRMIPAHDFFLSIFTTALAPEELLVAVHFPLAPQPTGWGFRLFTRRAGDFALALVACSLRLSREDAADVRLAIGGAGTVPMRLDGAVPSGRADAAWIARAAQAAAAAVDIADDEQYSAEYRRELITALARDAIGDAVERAR